GESAESFGAVSVQDTLALYVDITPNAQTASIGSVVSFSGSYIDLTSTVLPSGLAWDMNYDGLNFTADITGTLTPTYVFNSPGPYRVALQVTDQQGLRQIREASVFINHYQGPEAVAGSDLSLFEGETVSFSGSYTDPDGTVSAEGITWDFDWDGEFVAEV